MLTLLETVKARLGLVDTTYDPLQTNFIQHASGRFEAHCRRQFARQENAIEEFEADRIQLLLSRYPVESVSQFELKTDEAEDWQLQADVKYLLRRQCIVSLQIPLGSSRELLRVTYTGGYVLPGNTPAPGQTTLPPELEQVCVEQVAYWYQNRDYLGIITRMESGSAFYQFSQLDLLLHVRALLDGFAKWDLG